MPELPHWLRRSGHDAFVRDSPIFVDDLELPALLVELVRDGRWPSNRRELGLCFDEDHPLRQATSIDKIVFDPPPFATVARHAAANPFWTWPCASPHEIDSTKAICIADLGLGADSPIVLDYSLDERSPRVLWLRWAHTVPADDEPAGRYSQRNHWTELADTFESFATLAGFIEHGAP